MNININTLNEIHILAIYDSDIQIATNPDYIDTYHSGNGDKKAYNLLHLNTLYDVKNIYVDIEIQKGKKRMSIDFLLTWLTVQKFKMHCLLLI